MQLGAHLSGIRIPESRYCSWEHKHPVIHIPLLPVAMLSYQELSWESDFRAPLAMPLTLPGLQPTKTSKAQAPAFLLRKLIQAMKAAQERGYGLSRPALSVSQPGCQAESESLCFLLTSSSSSRMSRTMAMLMGFPMLAWWNKPATCNSKSQRNKA